MCDLVLSTRVSEQELQNLENFVRQHPNSNFFQSRFAFDTFKQTKYYEPLLILAIKNDAIIGSVIGTIIREGNGLKGLVSRRCIVWGGPLVKNNDIVVYKALVEKLSKVVSNRTIYTQFRNLSLLSKPEVNCFKQLNFNYYAHLDILHDLTIPIEKQWMKIHNGRRKNIKRAINRGLIFREINNKTGVDQSYELIKQTYRRIKLPLADKSFFDVFFTKLVDKGILKIFAAYSEDVIVSARLVLCYNSTIYDWYSGTNDNYLDKYPNDFMPWKIMEWGTKNGFKKFTFGGAGKPDKPYGVRDYKLKYGGKLVEYGRFEKTNNKLLFAVGKIGLELYKALKC